MYRIRSENINRLQSHNIRVSQLNRTRMSNPRKIVHLPMVRMGSGGRSAGVRITNIKSIRPPDAETAQSEEDRLRAQLQKEIVSRSRSCAYKKYKCILPVLWGRQYCGRHITSDPTAPYAKCAHDRCTMPAAPDNADHQLCFEHACQAMYSRHKSTAPPPPVTTTETLLNQLQHYVKAERTRTTSCASVVSVVSEPADQEILPHAVDPFKQIDAIAINNQVSSSIMECGSASESDADSVTISGGMWGESLSDTEDAPVEDQPLWRAGVFTAEEAVSEAKNALKQLQTAYIGQMSRLKTVLQTARHQYLKSLKAEKEQYCSINSQSLSGPLTIKERRQLRKLKAYASYRRKHGVEAVLARKLQHKRAKVNDITVTSRPLPSAYRCTFTEGGVRCLTHVLPAAKHCLKHIIHDRQQVLFHPCDDMRGGVPCREPIARLPLPSNACRYHTNPPIYTVFTLKKDDSDSESDTNCSTDSRITMDDLAPALVPDTFTP